MPTACIQQSGAGIRLVSERLVVTIPDSGDGAAGESRRDIPLRDLENMVMGEGVSITTPALTELLKRRIPVSMVDRLGRFLGSFQPAAPASGAARLRHYQCSLDPGFVISIAARIVEAKIGNQRRVLQRLASNRREQEQGVPPGIPACLARLERIQHRLPAAESAESLRGHEGAAAASYFESWAGFLPDDFPFVRRSTRPPLNAVNAVISYVATMLYGEMHATIHARGLDPSLGLLHTTTDGRWSLALDLIEPFRPVLVEALAVDLFSRRMLRQEHFEPSDGGIYLTREGRSKVILQYEKRMDRQFLSEHCGHRTTLRQQLDHQVVMFKRGLDSPLEFKPFRMN